MNYSLPFEVVGYSRSSLIVLYEGKHCFISTKVLCHICNHPGTAIRVVTLPEHIVVKCGKEINYPASHWIEAAVFTRR